MPRNEDWWRLQDELSRQGYLAREDVRDIVTDADITPTLQDAIARAGGAGGENWADPIRLQDVNRYIPVVEALRGRFCGVPDRGGTIGTQTFGSPKGRWSRGVLRLSIDTTGCNFVNAPGAMATPAALIATAFRRWQAVSPFFNFIQVQVNAAADIRVVFGGSEVDSRFGAAGGVLASGGYPEQGNLQFDSAETWSDGSVANTSNLLAVAVHEVGHILGLSHSSRPGGTMYPYQTPIATVDAESQSAIRAMYGWTPQQPLPDRATSDRVALGVTSITNFSGRIETARMVWKGVRNDTRLYESDLLAGGWTPQRPIPRFGASHGPALAEIGTGGAPPSTGLLMAWKGLPGDQGLYWSRDNGTGWQPQQRILGVGSSTRPALANVGGRIVMAWKGIEGDSGIYWSVFDGGGGWAPQKRVPGVGTSDSPTLASIGDRLFMFWKGIAGDSNGYWSVHDFASDPIWRPQRRIEYFSYQTEGGIPVAIGTTGGLSAARRGGDILLAWKGLEGDSGIYVSLFADGEFGGQIRVPDVGTAIGPTVGGVDGSTLMAWKGIEDDDVIYWSRL